MINKTSLFLAAALISGSAFAASADPMTDDVNTGLPTTIYNAPLAQLQQEGLPLSPSARAYLAQHPVASRRSAKAPRAVVNESATYQSGVTFEDKQSGGNY